MGSSSDLVSRLDFDIGLVFQDDVRRRFRSPVHHPFPTPVGSFFLLVTFRRHLFRLTEDSVALALQSCLGGRALDFHVKLMSNNHFRFSVFSKEVGFFIYKLRRVISSTFDCFFISRTMALPTGNARNVLGRLKRKRNGLKSVTLRRLLPNPRKKSLFIHT